MATGALPASSGSSGGGGNMTSTGTEAAIPGAGTAGNLYLPSDGLWLQRDTGAAWVPWGPIWPLGGTGMPSTWVNQGSATLDSTRGVSILTVPVGSSSDSFRCLVKTAPSTPYTVTALFQTDHWPMNYYMSGLFFRQSSDGKMIFCEYHCDGGGLRTYEVLKLNSATSVNGAVTLTAPTRNLGENALVWMQISDDGTNRKMRVSSNGYTWVEMYSETRTTFLTADQVGWGVDNYNATRGYTMTLLSWKET